MAKLTPKQAKILNYIEKEIARHGRPPTYRDIAAHCGYEAVGTVQDHIRALIQKGFLEKEAGLSRGIRLTHHSAAASVPILGVVPAGKPIEATQNMLGTLPAPFQSGELFALEVKGESMIEAGIMEGDYVVVKKQSTAENGDIVVALVEGEVTVKYLERRGDRVRLIPANPRFQPIELNPEAENAIQGKVVSVQRYYG